jgi:16S rRNA (adenine1518-N6/adenine1519-N6)-dimethyltransferase
MKKIGTVNKTKETLKKYGFHVKKKFGQNFLVDQNILKKIVDIPTINKDTLVVEIGPGLGSLTEHLLEKSKHVLAYEIDKELVNILSANFNDNNLSIIGEDFLKRDVDADIKSLNIDYKNVVVVANLPYYITTPIILKIIEESRIIKELVVMTQLEVARRLTSKPSTKDYNSLSVAIQYKTISEIAMKVPKNVFIPAPNVDSAIVKLTIKDEIELKPLSEEHFYNLVRSSFKQRRKTLVNNLHVRYNQEKVNLISYLEDLELNGQIRAENLSVSDFVRLSDYLLDKDIK